MKIINIINKHLQQKGSAGFLQSQDTLTLWTDQTELLTTKVHQDKGQRFAKR